MRNRRLLTFMLAFHLLGVLASHALTQTSASGSECANAETTAAMRACENARYLRAEKDLNAAYKELMKRLDNAQKEKLRLVQRAWLRFRDTDGDFQADSVRGGTLGPLLRVAALADLTEARTAELRKSLGP
jgi:uncharacterized protein YecT (DUF1311 family)